VVDNPVDYLKIRDKGDELQQADAFVKEQRVDLVDLPDHCRPAAVLLARDDLPKYVLKQLFKLSARCRFALPLQKDLPDCSGSI